MPDSEEQNILSNIEDSYNEIAQQYEEHKYNIMMIKSKQLIEYMVRCLLEKFDIEEEERMLDTIDILYQRNILSQRSRDNYHRIRTMGNAAINVNDNNSYNGQSTYDKLGREVEIFSEIYTEEIPEILKPKGNDKENSMDKSSNTKKYNQDQGVALSNVSSISEKMQRSRTKSAKKRRTQNIFRFLLTIAVPVLVLLLLLWLAFVIRGFAKKIPTRKEATTIETTISVTSTESMEETTAAPKTYVTTSALNVRSAPSTDGEKLTTLPVGTVVDYVNAYDNNWAIINYNGAQAYVASQYLREQ